MIFDITIAEQQHRLQLELVEGAWRCRLDGREVEVDAVLARRDVLSLIVNGRSYQVKRERTSHETLLSIGPLRYRVDLSDPRSLRSRKAKTLFDHGPIRLIAAMPGKVVRVLAEEKAEVKAGQGVLVIEAMKMQNELKSPKHGIVQKIMAGEGARVNAGDVLAVVE
jgi:biotin carboxyl carrier protein